MVASTHQSHNSYQAAHLTRPSVEISYDVKEEVTIQADASQTGLGFALLQNGQPAAYGARSLIPTEQNYAQIEKEMLAIVVPCEKFEQYIYGRHVTVESDHKPLVTIHRKPMHSVPKCLLGIYVTEATEV